MQNYSQCNKRSFIETTAYKNYFKIIQRQYIEDKWGCEYGQR